ncbi:hypothetical protein QTP86_000063 [Hemibagrus guttatus]|nr:hypothetical protein QTP86_000063 [Hemibagrus guttatus]
MVQRDEILCYIAPTTPTVRSEFFKPCQDSQELAFCLNEGECFIIETVAGVHRHCSSMYLLSSFIVFCLSGAGSRGQQSKQGCPDLPLPRHFLQLFRRDPEAFQGQPRDIVSPACLGSSPGPLPGGVYPEHLSRETSRRHPKQMPEPPQLPPFDVEEQRLYSELLPGDRAPYPISKGAPRHPTEEAHFGCLYPGSYLFGHDPELMTIGESRNVD